MTGIAIADTPETLTATWLTEALHSSGVLAERRAVSSVRLAPIGTGQMSDAVRLTLDYDGATDAPSKMIAKLPAADEASRAAALSLRSYENEVRFYQQLADELPVCTPAVYYADIEPDTARFVLLLEDLAPARSGDQLEGCTPPTAVAAVDELVKLHAPRWDDPKLADLEWLHRDRTATNEFMLALLPGLWSGFCDRYGTAVVDDVLEAGAVVFGALETYLLADTAPWTVVHSDFRLDNLLFDRRDGGLVVTVVDWQTCTHGPGPADVAYFLGAGLGLGDRRALERSVVDRYHRGLVDLGVSGYDRDRCWRDYRRGTWSGLLVAVAASMLVERTERGDRMFLTMAARHARHALDLHAAEVIDVR